MTRRVSRIRRSLSGGLQDTARLASRRAAFSARSFAGRCDREPGRDGRARAVGGQFPAVAFRACDFPDMRETLAAHVDAMNLRAAQTYDATRAVAYRKLKLHGLREAPAILAIFSDEAPTAGHGLGIATMPEMLRYSTVMAIHTLWLAARTQGIGVGWVSILEPSMVAALLDVPERWSLIAILCLGYPESPSTEPELQAKGWQDRLAVVTIER